MANDDRSKKIAELTERLNQVATNPTFIGLVNQLNELPDDEQRKDFVRREMNVTALAKKGIPAPEGLRSVVRVFEDPADGAIQPGETVAVTGSTPRALEEAAGTTVCASLGQWFCVSVGSEF